MNAAAPALECEALSVTYPIGWNGARVQALAGVSLRIPTGSIVALTGGNGSGKSTLLRVAAGLLTQGEGVCRVWGGPVAAARRAGWIGFQPDTCALPRHRRVRSWLKELWECAPAAREGKSVDQVLAEGGLADHADRAMGALSLGLRRRVILAQAMLGNPRLLLLDEPESALDLASMDRLAASLRAFSAAGGAVLFSSHVFSRVEELADQVVLMEAGRMIGAVGRAEVAQAGGLPQVFRRIRPT